MKGFSKSQSKYIKFDEYKNCLDGEEYEKDCDIYILRSLNHEMNLQQVKKCTLSLFVDKRCYIKETKCKPWNYSYLLL